MLSRGLNVRVVVIRGVIVLGSYPGVIVRGWELSEGNYPGCSCPGGNWVTSIVVLVLVLVLTSLKRPLNRAQHRRWV